MLKRVFLFVLTNIAVLVMVSIVLAVLGQLGVLDMAGSPGRAARLLRDLGLRRRVRVAAHLPLDGQAGDGRQLIGPDTRDPDAQWLYDTVGRLTQQANLPMPEVGIYESPELNAFATGPSKKRSLVAVSSGLLGRWTTRRSRASSATRCPTSRTATW